MYLFIDERAPVRDAFAASFTRDGVAASGLSPVEFEHWLEGATKAALSAIEGVLLGEDDERPARARRVRGRTTLPVIAVNDVGSLEQTLHLFAAGVDDVVRKPIHVREIMARCRAIRRRDDKSATHADCGAIRTFFDGRDPHVGGAALPLPRRERRILEFLVTHKGRRVTKAQIFHAIYGLFDDVVEENVVESHVSKLRKKLRARLGYDPVESKRFLGYCLQDAREPARMMDGVAVLRDSMPPHLGRALTTATAFAA